MREIYSERDFQNMAEEREAVRKDKETASLIRKVRKGIGYGVVLPLTLLNLFSGIATKLDIDNGYITSSQVKENGYIANSEDPWNYVVDGAGYIGVQLAAENAARRGL